MELTKEQIEFLDKVCDGSWKLNSNGEVDVDGSVNMYYMNLTEIPVKFGNVKLHFRCSKNNLTTLKNCPNYVGDKFTLQYNNLTNYFKNIKEEDFPHWDKLFWGDVIREYPFLINIVKKYKTTSELGLYLGMYPQTKLYLE